MPFSPQYPIYTLVESIGEQNQHLQTGSSFPPLNLRELPLGNVEVSSQFLLQNLPSTAAIENKALLGFVWERTSLTSIQLMFRSAARIFD